MKADTIREWLGRRPFEPFVVRLSNGERHEVRHPENVMVLKTRIIIGFPEVDRAVHCSLIQVNAIEALQPVSPRPEMRIAGRESPRGRVHPLRRVWFVGFYSPPVCNGSQRRQRNRQGNEPGKDHCDADDYRLNCFHQRPE